MATNTIFVKRHDDARALNDTLNYEDGTPIDLTDASVVLIWNGERKSSVSIEDETAGEVSYTLTTEDVAEAGTVELEWEITFNNGKQLSVPTSNRIVLRILPDLG